MSKKEETENLHETVDFNMNNAGNIYINNNRSDYIIEC